jgi:hypothetical protein
MTSLVTMFPTFFSNTPATASAPGDSDIFSFNFHDLVSVVNPLQHLPIVSLIYRAATGDTIKPLERIAGDTLYGGLWGLVSSVANVAFQEITGKDFGDTAIALLEGNDGAQDVASGQPAPSPLSAATVTPTAVASVAPQLIASAPTAMPMPRTASSQRPSHLASQAGSNSALSQRAASAYRKSLALPIASTPID